MGHVSEILHAQVRHANMLSWEYCINSSGFPQVLMNLSKAYDYLLHNSW